MTSPSWPELFGMWLEALSIFIKWELFTRLAASISVAWLEKHCRRRPERATAAKFLGAAKETPASSV
jgi:hypothetical protein